MVEFIKKPGSISTVMTQDWLLQGCPLCGCQEWHLTNDGWAYCYDCNKGFSTYGIWTNHPLIHFDEQGQHCFMCKGYGEIKDEPCDECDGKITNKKETNDDE